MTTPPESSELTTTDGSAASSLAVDVPPSKVATRLGVIPGSVEEAWRLAKMMAQSGLVPEAFQNKPHNIMVALQLGAELGLAPMSALQSICVINGRPTIWGDGFLGVIMRSPLYQDHDEFYEVDGTRCEGLVPDDWKDDTTAAVCTFIRRHKPDPVTRRFTVGQARKAGLLSKTGTWQTYPDRMLAMRARAFAGRDAFPDLLRGLHTAEEMRDVDELPPAAAPPAIVRRLSDSPKPVTPVPVLDTIGPLRVTSVDLQDEGVSLVTLEDGHTLLANRAEAIELAKFAGTNHPLRFACDETQPGEAAGHLHSFTIAD